MQTVLRKMSLRYRYVFLRALRTTPRSPRVVGSLVDWLTHMDSTVGEKLSAAVAES